MAVIDLDTGPPASEDGAGAGENIPHVRLAIVGTGFAGLGLAIRLREAGIEDFVLIERADDVGGTWQANTYPGCQCDVPSHLYSFSFAPNPGWTRTYSKPAGDLAVPARPRRPPRPAPPHPLRPRADRRGVGQRRAALERRDLAGRLDGAAAHRRDRPAELPGGPADPRHGQLQGHDVPHRRVGPRPRPHRRARGGHRHGRVGGPGRAADRRARRAAARLPAHRAVDPAALRPPHDADRAAAVQDVPVPAEGRAQRRVLEPRELPARLHQEPEVHGRRREDRRRAHAQAGQGPRAARAR